MAWRGLHISRPSRLTLQSRRLVVEQEEDESVASPLEDVVRGEIGMVRLHRGDHRIDGAPLKRMHGRGSLPRHSSTRTTKRGSATVCAGRPHRFPQIRSRVPCGASDGQRPCGSQRAWAAIRSRSVSRSECSASTAPASSSSPASASGAPRTARRDRHARGHLRHGCPGCLDFGVPGSTHAGGRDPIVPAPSVRRPGLRAGGGCAAGTARHWRPACQRPPPCPASARTPRFRLDFSAQPSVTVGARRRRAPRRHRSARARRGAEDDGDRARGLPGFRRWVRPRCAMNGGAITAPPRHGASAATCSSGGSHTNSRRRRMAV